MLRWSKAGTAPATLTTPCTVLALFNWLSGHITQNPGVFTNDSVVTTGTTINITPV